MTYYEISIGRTAHSGTVIPKEELEEKARMCRMQKLELYRSVFTFDDKIVEHMKSGRKSASGFIGTYFLDTIVFDIDKQKDSDQFVLHRAKMFYDSLLDNYKFNENDVHIYFSGTGYHFEIPNIFGFSPSQNLHKEVKATIDAYFPESDSVFYHLAGLIRVPNTINNKSGLYKIPLKEEEFVHLSYSEIHKLAEKPREELIYTQFSKDYTIYPHLIQRVKEENNNNDPLNLIGSASRKVSCVQHMYNLGEEEGTRHERIMRMASAWRRAGIPEKAIISMMKNYAPSLSSYEVEKYVTDIFKKGYSYSCQDKIMKQFCDPKCEFYAHKDYTPDIISMKEMEKQYKKHIGTDFTGRAFNLRNLSLFKSLQTDFWIYPGYYVNLIGGTGLNKTSFYQNLAIELKDFSILYLSTEFGNRLLFRRFTQIFI